MTPMRWDASSNDGGSWPGSGRSVSRSIMVIRTFRQSQRSVLSSTVAQPGCLAMNTRSVGNLAFRILALVAVLMAIGPGARALPTLVVKWPYDSYGGSPSLMLASILAPIILPLVFGAVLWFEAERLSGNADVDADAGTSPSIETLQKLAFTCIGVYILALAIPDVAKVIYYYWQLSVPGGSQIGTGAERGAAIVGTAVEIAIGLWLVLGAGGLANLIHRLRDR